jgi:hypothetical protein
MVSASTSVVKDQKRSYLRRLEVFGRILAVAAILHDVEADLLALYERAHSGAFNGRDVNEDVRLTAALLNEAKAFGGIEELHGSSSHDDFLSICHSRDVCRAKVRDKL